MRLFDYVQLDDEHYLQVAPKDQGKADMISLLQRPIEASELTRIFNANKNSIH